MNAAMPLSAYRREMHRRGLAAPTIKRRMAALHSVEDWVAPRGILDATTEDIEAFLDARGDLHPRTRYDWISHLHCFYEWAAVRGLVGLDPTLAITRPKTPKLLPRPIPEPDLALALERADRLMAAWLTLAAYAGLRVSEIARLQRHDVLDAERLLRVHGKGGKDRMVPMADRVTRALDFFGMPRRGHLFTRPRGAPFPPAMVSREISLYLEGLGIDATAHMLRHRFATRAYRASRGDLRLVQEMLGHASPTTTAIYTAWDQEAGAAVVADLD